MIRGAFHRATVALLVLLAMLSFGLKPLMAFVYRPYFSYVNGSDEQLYLTYQGALSLLGYRTRLLSSYLVKLLHDVGLSGAVINLVFDVVTPLLLLAVVAVAIKRLWGETHAVAYSWLMVFGQVLFNQSNPLLEGLLPDFRYQDTFWVSAFEGFAPYIRTPEPQLSYLLMAAMLLVYLFVHRRLYVFFLPIPLLYDSVLLGYCYLLGVACLIGVNGVTLKLAPGWRLTLLACGLAAIGLSFGIWAADQMGLFKSLATMATHYRHTHMPALSANLLFSLAAWTLAQAVGRAGRPAKLEAAALATLCLQLFISNHQIISGVSIFPQGIQSTWGTMGSAFLLYYLVRSLVRFRRFSGWSVFYAASFLSLFSINNSQGMRFWDGTYRLDIGHDISEADLADLRANPFNHISATQFLKAYIGLAYPRQLLPLFSHQYFFPWFMGVCEPQLALHREAIAFLRANLDDENLTPYRTQLEDEIVAVEAAIAAQPDSISQDCPFETPTEPTFHIVPTPDDLMVLLKANPPGILRQGIDF